MSCGSPCCGPGSLSNATRNSDFTRCTVAPLGWWKLERFPHGPDEPLPGNPLGINPTRERIDMLDSTGQAPCGFNCAQANYERDRSGRVVGFLRPDGHVVMPFITCEGFQEFASEQAFRNYVNGLPDPGDPNSTLTPDQQAILNAINARFDPGEVIVPDIIAANTGYTRQQVIGILGQLRQKNRVDDDPVHPGFYLAK